LFERPENRKEVRTMALVPALRRFERWAAVALGLALLLACAVPAAAQKKKKNKKDILDNTSANPIVPMTDEQQIDYLISEVLGAWQIGDLERMHKDYSDDVSVVSGRWEPPIIGWANYAEQFKKERDQMQQVRLDRMNTYIRVHGDVAWANYQWEFSAVVNGVPRGARGQTTLVIVKTNNQWKIVHDHTSVVQTAQPQAPENEPKQPPPQPTKPGQ
jgi:ketosteroid isomerase-like protein